MPRKSASSASTQESHYGFTEGGKLFRSDTPVTNACTNWVRLTCRRIVSEYLSPADVVGLLRSEPEYIQKLLAPKVLADWAGIERFWQWPTAYTSNSVARCLKQFGKQYPLWESDESEWTRLCDAAEHKLGHVSRFDGLVKTDTHELVCRLADKLAMPK